MQTKFSQILKVKKQKVDECERELLDIQNVRKKILGKIEDLKTQIIKTQKPTSGTITQLNLVFSIISSLTNQVKELENDIISINRQIEGLKELYKEANIEFEKIKYLNSEEIKGVIKLQDLQEKKDMDEISNILFSRKKEAL
jgi:flagellar export protein FliJ